MKFNIWSRFFSKYKTEQNYRMTFRVSYPLSSGTYSETGVIGIDIPASNPQEAKKKLQEYFKQKVKLTLVDVKEQVKEPSKNKNYNPVNN